MKDFMAIKDYNGRNVLREDIFIPNGTFIDAIDDFMYFEGIPFCTITSQDTRDFFVWAADGRWSDRKYAEELILFNPRAKIWEEEITIYDKDGKPTETKTVTKVGRFSPEERKYIRENFPNLLEEDVFLFNDYFFIGSNIEEIIKLANYVAGVDR